MYLSLRGRLNLLVTIRTMNIALLLSRALCAVLLCSASRLPLYCHSQWEFPIQFAVNDVTHGDNIIAIVIIKFRNRGIDRHSAVIDSPLLFHIRYLYLRN